MRVSFTTWLPPFLNWVFDGMVLPSNTQFKKGHADVIGDLDLARLVLAGEATAVSDNDWWALDLMA